MKKLIVAVAAIALMASSAYAAEWNFYGEAKIWTGWHDIDPVEGTDDGDYYDTNYDESLLTNSKIGANIVVSDELTARFEYGTSGGNANIRYLYGVWNFGGGTLTVGQADTPINVGYSNQVYDNELGLGGFGDFDNDRHPELMLTFGGFSVAFLAPNTEYTNNNNAATATDFTTQAIFPMIAMCYKMAFDMGEAQIAGAYNRFEIQDDEDIDSYAIGLGTQMNFGALGMFATFVWGENIGNIDDTETEYQGLAVYAGGEVYDCETIGGTIGVNFAVSEMLTLEAGYGYIHDELDDVDDTSIAQTYYVQAATTLAPGVTVTPEIGMIDYREVGEEEILYYGASWKIAF
jgi:opacity protein-like surface antigen